MNVSSVWLQPVGRLLLRCLVGKYGTILLTGALALLVGAGAYLSLVYDHTVSSGAAQGMVYSVAAVDANLEQYPSDWLGRTVQVRGVVVPCMAIPNAGGGPCAELSPGFGQIDRYGQSTWPTIYPLPVVRGDLDPSLSLLRRVPLLGRLAPAPQVLHWGVVATYRVQLASVSDSQCGVGTCAEGRLLDSAL